MPYQPDQMIINHYTPGQGIHPHVDKTHCFEGVVGSLGLGSSCIMEFKYFRSPLCAQSLYRPKRTFWLCGVTQAHRDGQAR